MLDELEYLRLGSLTENGNYDWTKHKYEIDLTHPGHQYFKRDGVEWHDITNVEVSYDAKNQIPLLIVECYANLEILKSDWAEREPFISNYTFENDPKTDTLKVFRDNELLEEVQKIELSRDSRTARVTKIRLTILADVSIKWNFNKLDERIKENDSTDQT